MAVLVKNGKNETKWSRKLRKFGQILDFDAETPNIAQNTHLCQILGYLGDRNRIYDHF